jgi:hypothetical protein
MAWRRRKAGRPRKIGAPRDKTGRLKPAAPTPPPTEALRQRAAALGVANLDEAARTQFEPAWQVDRLWAAGLIDDAARAAGQHYRALTGAWRADASAPRLARLVAISARGAALADDRLHATLLKLETDLKRAGHDIAALRAAVIDNGAMPPVKLRAALVDMATLLRLGPRR